MNIIFKSIDWKLQVTTSHTFFIGYERCKLMSTDKMYLFCNVCENVQCQTLHTRPWLIYIYKTRRRINFSYYIPLFEGAPAVILLRIIEAATSFLHVHSNHEYKNRLTKVGKTTNDPFYVYKQQSKTNNWLTHRQHSLIKKTGWLHMRNCKSVTSSDVAWIRLIA